MLRTLEVVYDKTMKERWASNIFSEKKPKSYPFVPDPKLAKHHSRIASIRRNQKYFKYC